MSDGPSETRRPRAFKLAPEQPTPSATDASPEGIDPPRAPRAFRTQAAAGVEIAEQPYAYALEATSLDQPADEVAVEIAQRRGMVGRGVLSWGGLFWSALGGLVSLGIGLWITRLIDDLFARVPSLGWIGLGLVALAGVALLAIVVRELVGIGRQRQVAVLHKALADAHATDDGAKARAGLSELAALYAKRPETARARQEMAALAAEIIDGRDLIDLGERHMMSPLDREVRREIALAAKRVSIVTAISPRAVLDLVFVVAQIVRLIRRIAEIYSGRPGLLGFLRLARSVGAHLAITGGMAVGDSLLQQIVGHGLAAKLSARLGEGVFNGLLTTRVGLSAMSVCRPMPFGALKPPGVKDVAPFLFGDKAE